jgi:hypothetical protein
MKTKEEWVDFIVEKGRQGTLVVSTIDGLAEVSIKDIINQPIDGLLYDLNRSPEVILTFIEDVKWINDYASMLVIKELKKQLDEARSKG